MPKELLAPNGKPSNLTPEQYNLVRTPAFKEWFGDWEKLILTKINDSGIDEVSLKRLEDGVSKVVDKNGEPMVVWHTTNNEFNKFDKRKSREGFFFSPQKNRLVVYNKSKINSYFLNLRNPSHEIFKLDLKYLKPKGYDGIMDYGHDKKSGNENLYEIIAFEPNQIKLADGTNTTFDVNNPDIRYAEGGEVIKNPTEIECHTCNWKWKVKDGGDDLFICHKCYTDNSKYYKFEGLEGEKILDTISSNNPNNQFDGGGILDGLTEEQITYIDIISNYDGKGELAEKYKKILKEKTGIDYDEYYGKIDDDLIKNADLKNIKTKNDFLNYDNWIKYSYEILRNRGFDKNQPQHIEGKLTFDKIKEFCDNLNIPFEIIPENLGSGNYASHSWGTIKIPIGVDINTFIHEIGHFYDWKNQYEGIAKNPAYATSFYYLRNSSEVYAENFMHYFIANEWLKENMPIVYEELDTTISLEYKKNIRELINTLSHFKKGGRTISQTPAPKKDQIEGSDKNKEGSSKDLKSAKQIELSDKTIETIKNKVDKHNEKHPNKKITLDSAKAVVRRGMGAYSSSHRPTISGGKPNSRVAWGLARLNAFLYKIVNGKSKSGKYSQDNDLIEELGYKVQKYEIGGIFQGTPHDFNAYSTEYIGTGEGNQVFGWGLYFTDQKDIARYYMSAGLYEDEEKILLDGKSLSEYDVEQEVKDQLVGIVNTIFEEDKLIPTIPLIKDYLVLEYDEENYPEFKELVEQSTKTWNFIQDKKLTFRGNIYSVTLFKGKNPNQYDLLQWEEKPTENQILKIKNQAEKESVDLSKLPFPLERYRDSNAIYTDLSRIISGVSHLNSRDSGKMCSNFLLRAGIDGIKYKAGTLSGFEGQEGYNYVIFDANDVTIEDIERYDEILAGKEKYADGGLLGNTFTEIIYYAMLHTATTTDIYAKGKDLDDIQSEYNSISASDFDNPNSNYNSKMLESRINKYEFIGDDSLSAEDYIDDLENTDYWNLISDDYDIIESDSVFAINKSTDEMIDEIREFIKQEYNIGGRYAEKYMTISVDDENGDFIADLIIRTADHSQNVKNNDRTSFNLSFVIANKNETMNRFIPLGEEYYYDDNSDIEDVKEEIKGIIDDKIEYIKENGKKYEDGGDIQAYKEAMGISEFKEGGEANPKKIYVSIELKTKIEGEYPNYFFRYNEKPFEELKNGVLEGVTGVSSSTSNVAEWFTAKDCLIVMDYEKFMASNQTETINYNDPYQLMANKLFLFKRLYGNITRCGEQKNVYEQTLTSICPKIRKEIILEMEISEGEKYRELYRIDRFLDTNNTSAFYRWANVKQDIESPIDLTNAILEFNKLDDSYLGDGFENPVLTFNELLPLVELGIINAGRIWESEQEIILKNRTLVLPKQSQLFFINKDEIGRVRASNQLKLVDKYKLKDLYKVYFVDRQDVEKYRTIWKKKYYQEKELQYEKSKYDLELKKDQVVNELFGIFINNSFKSFKEQYEKDYISDLSESRMFYDTESDDYKETYWQGIVLVQFILNEYIEIVQRNWKRFIESKSVENLNLYSFSNFYDEVKYELQEFFEKNKDELEKINDWSEIRGNGYLNLWGMEYLLKKSVYDYEDLPEWIDYKELSKMYLDKMGRELYRYYDKKDLPLISQYKDGGESDEPTHFWGTEAGGVLVYCSTTDRYLILLRSEWVLEPNTWGIISGKLDDDETNIEDAVLRESEEETGHKLGDLIPSFVFEKPNFKFHNFVSIVEEEFTPELDWENSDYKWVKLDEMPENLHFGLKLLLEKEDIPTLVEKNKNNTMNKNNPKDEVTFNIPLLIRFAELMREDIKTDVALHEVIENIIDIKDKGVLTMSDYDSIIGNVIGTEEKSNMNVVEEEKMEEGGKVESIKSKKGDIKLMLDENWYSDDTEVELVPVSELVKFREFDRKITPKYNKENSVDNINHLKFMFQKDGVKSPLIIEYSKEDNAVLIIEGNHRLNSAIDLGMEYLPARVVLKKYSKFTKNQLKNAMKVSGVEGNEFGYIPSNMKPSKVGIQGTKPIVFGDGGIIEGRLHSECDAEEGCGRKFQVGENGHVIEAERDEAVIVADAFQNNEELTIKGTPSEVASALNVIGGGKNFDKGAEIIKNGQELDIPELKKQAIDTDVDDVIDSGSIIINRRSMADEKEYEVTGTPKQIASAINSINGNGVVIEKGAEIKEN
jgi:8-oxo-dGTP pyrophosphatase MutT (NUDIX family)